MSAAIQIIITEGVRRGKKIETIKISEMRWPRHKVGTTPQIFDENLGWLAQKG